MVAAGQGSRFGGPKQMELLGGRRVLEHAVASAGRHCAGGVVLVLPPGTDGDVLDVDPAPSRWVAGGSTRADSVRAGLAAVPGSAEVVVVHDAARPLASAALFERVLAAVAAGADGAVPALAVADTLKRVDGDRVVATVDRTGLVGVQTPQAFRASVLRAAHAAGGDATDDAGLVEAAGGSVVVVPGDPANAKITDPADLVLARQLLAPVVRVGHGFDSHERAAPGAGELVLGGVVWPGEVRLAGHSDGDALAHAVTDALLGAAGLGDIGSWFPDTDPGLAGADSIALLERAARAVEADGWRLTHVDATVVASSPRLATRRAEVEERLSAAAGGTVSVKGKRPEGFAGGLAEGAVAAWAVATLLGPGGGSAR